jgi:hypothetical protein
LSNPILGNSAFDFKSFQHMRNALTTADLHMPFFDNAHSVCPEIDGMKRGCVLSHFPSYHAMNDLLLDSKLVQIIEVLRPIEQELFADQSKLRRKGQIYFSVLQWNDIPSRLNISINSSGDDT